MQVASNRHPGRRPCSTSLLLLNSENKYDTFQVVCVCTCMFKHYILQYGYVLFIYVCINMHTHIRSLEYEGEEN